MVMLHTLDAYMEKDGELFKYSVFPLDRGPRVMIPRMLAEAATLVKEGYLETKNPLHDWSLLGTFEHRDYSDDIDPVLGPNLFHFFC